MKNTDFLEFQVLKKFMENSSSAWYQAASAHKLASWNNCKLFWKILHTS